MKRIKLKVNHLVRDGGDYLVQYLTSLGINKFAVSSFLNHPVEGDQDDPLMLDNIQYAVKMAYEALTKENAHVFVQIDSDTDGYTSSAVLINYLKRRFPAVQISYALHPGKEHGIIPSNIPETASVVFIPDAGSNDYDEQKWVCAQDKLLIILDHHEVNDYQETSAILVNNQSSAAFTNKSLSGVGIVYMFIQVMDKTYFANDPIYRDYLDLTAIGIIADAMNMTTLGNNYIAYYGLSNIKNNFIKELAVRQARGIKDPKHLTKIDVAFYIAPVINGVIRNGTTEDKQMVFRALTENDSTEEFVTEWRGATRHESLFQYAARLAANAKSRQDSAKKKAFEWVCDEIREKGLDKHNIIIVPLNAKQSSKISPNLTGLIAMELVKEFNKPCLLLRETEMDGKLIYGGSGRNGNFYGLTNLLDFLHESGYVHYAAGHQGAFGCFIEPSKIPMLTEYADRMINAATFNDLVYEVDYWFYGNEDLDIDMLMAFAKHANLWGNSLPQPKFAVDRDFTSGQVILMGKNKDSIRLTLDGVDFVIFSDPELAAKIGSIRDGHVTIVGRPQLNEWNGHTTVQIIVDDIEVQEIIKNTNKNNLLDLI